MPSFAQTHLSNLTGINGPTFLAIDPNRTIGGTTATWLYVAEHGATDGTGGGRILRYNLTSGSTTPTVVATAGTGPGQFTSPDAILVLSSGDLVIADRFQNRVQVISNTGTQLMAFGQGTNPAGADFMDGPLGLAIDGTGAIYVTEHDTHMVSKYTINLATDTATRVWRKSGTDAGGPAFNVPYGALVNGSSLLISDGLNGRVQVWNLNGEYQTDFSVGGGVIPLGLFRDGAGTLWIAESNGNYMNPGTVNRITRRNASGTEIAAAFGTQGTGNGQFRLPFHAVVNSATNRAYVADYENDRVQIFDLTTSGGGAAPVISSATTASATVGVAFSYQIVASNSPTSYAATGLAGTGLAISTSTGVISGTPTTAGTITSQITATNATGSDTETLTITVAPASGGGDTTAPTIVGFSLGTGNTLTVANFNVVFSEPVTGVDEADFAVNATGTTSGSVTDVTGSGANYNVVIAYAGEPGPTGSIQLGIRTSGTGITDAAGNPFLGGGITATEPIPVNATVLPDPTSPVAVSVAGGTVSGTTLPFTITFDEAVTGVSASDVFVTTTGTATATVGTVTGSGTTWTANVMVGGTGTVQLTVVGGVSANIRNASTHWLRESETSAAVSVGGSSGGSAPVVSNATVVGQVGTPITAVQVAATNSPTSFSAPGLATYGLSISSSGLITGTPTATASGATVSVTATNATGTSAPATITLNITSSSGGGSAPVVSNATVVGQVGTPITAVQVAATTSPTSFSAPGLASYGLSISASGLITGTPTATASGATLSVTATNATGTSAPATITLNITSSSGGGSAPVVSNATVSGEVGSAITAVQVAATNSPTSFSAPGLASYGLSISASGLITGTPTATANGATVSVTATNATGTSAPATITLNIIEVEEEEPAPEPKESQSIEFEAPENGIAVNEAITLEATATSGLPVSFTLISGPATLNDNVLTATGAGTIRVLAAQGGDSTYDSASLIITLQARQTQTIEFVPPTSALVINTPIALSATTSAGNLPITFSLVQGNATLVGNTLTATGPGQIIVRASQAGNATYAATSVEVDFGNPAKAAQTINLAAMSDVTVAAPPIALAPTSSAGLPITYTVSGPARISGNSLVLTGAPGTVTLRATQAGNSTYNPAVEVVRTFRVTAIGQQVYLGNIGSDTFAVAVSTDGTKGVFVTRFAQTGEAIVATFTINADGSFSANGTSSLPASAPAGGVVSDAPATAAATAPRTINGTVADGVVSGTIVELGRSFNANAQPATGTTASLAGVYVASMPGSASGETYIVAGPTGQAFAVAVTPFGVSSGTGTIAANGAITIAMSGGATITGNVNSSNGTVNGTFTRGQTTAALIGLSQDAERTDRLVNVSSRLRVVGGDASRSVIAGFVITGNAAKRVLVRAVGPGLADYGVQDPLANPRLQIFRGDTLVAENDDWSNNGDVAAVSASVGAFALANGSRDAALVVTLEPGAYTAIITGVEGNGVGLIEIYDGTSGAQITSEEIINISTRGFVEGGEGNVIAGFVVTGNAPKRVLIRGVGPGLAQYGVPNVLADPSVKLFAAGGTTVIAQNDNWGTPQPIDDDHAAASAADISAASAAAGAFPLDANSNDAAIVITLMPGAYSAVVSGANNATGAAIVEVYELSSP